MNAFFVDLLHDLREKKLWPVAAVLLLAVVATPAVLLKSGSAGSDEASVVPPAQSGPTGADAAVVALATDEGADVSGLERFEEKNPFADAGGGPQQPDGDVPTPEELSELLGGGESPASGGIPTGSPPGSGGSTPPSGGDGGGAARTTTPATATPSRSPTRTRSISASAVATGPSAPTAGSSASTCSRAAATCRS